MASLYKRANKRQRQMLAIVEGAVKCAIHAHPSMAKENPKFARSIAKRAVGMLSAFESGGTLAASGVLTPEEATKRVARNTPLRPLVDCNPLEPA